MVNYFSYSVFLFEHFFPLTDNCYLVVALMRVVNKTSEALAESSLICLLVSPILLNIKLNTNNSQFNWRNKYVELDDNG